MANPTTPVKCSYCELNPGPAESVQFIRFARTALTVLYLHRDQSLPGRMVIATRDHFADITDLPDDVQQDFYGTGRAAARAVRAIFPSTTKINLAIGGNLPEYNHPHLHLVPRQVGDRRWPDFALDVQQPFWPAGDARYQQTIDQLLAHADLRSASVLAK